MSREVNLGRGWWKWRKSDGVWGLEVLIRLKNGGSGSDWVGKLKRWEMVGRIGFINKF